MKIPLFCLTNENKFFDINTILLFTKTLSISEKIKKKIYVIFYSIFFFFLVKHIYINTQRVWY